MSLVDSIDMTSIPEGWTFNPPLRNCTINKTLENLPTQHQHLEDQTSNLTFSLDMNIVYLKTI